MSALACLYNVSRLKYIATNFTLRQQLSITAVNFNEQTPASDALSHSGNQDVSIYSVEL